MLARRFKIPLLKAALKSTAGWKTAKKKPTSTTYQQHPKYSGGTDRTSATANTKTKKNSIKIQPNFLVENTFLIIITTTLL